MNEIKTNSEADALAECPKCGMQEGATACRQYPNMSGVIDVGWKCTKCGYMWGFEWSDDDYEWEV
jgi:C4-type Zn-finger protein